MKLAWTEGESAVSVDVRNGKIILEVKSGSIALEPDVALEVGKKLCNEAEKLSNPF